MRPNATKPGTTPAAPKQRLLTSDVAALLDVVARVQRDHLEASRAPGGLTPTAMTADQLREWFARERYVYGEEIAEGGMAKILCAADLHLCRTVALKTLLDGKAAESLSRFVLEAQVTAQLQHPNVVPIYDVGMDPHTRLPFFVMKLIAGRSMLDIILSLRHKGKDVRRFVSLAERINIFLKACDAIAFAHSRHVIHRDVKPSNVMVGDFGEVYVIDWGIAECRAKPPPPDPRTGRLRFEPARVSSFHDVYHLSGTTESTFMGSPVHMAPEQLSRPETVDERADIYGLGCTLYEFITLHAPFDGMWPIERLIHAKRTGEFVPAWEHCPDARYGIGPIIHTCMAPRRSDRYRTVAAVQVALKDYLHSVIHHEGPRRIQELETFAKSLTPGHFDEHQRRALLRRIAAVRRNCPASAGVVKGRATRPCGRSMPPAA